MARLSVKFNEIELNEYIIVLEGYTSLVGADWNPTMDERPGALSGEEFEYTKYCGKQINMPFAIEDDINENYDKLQKVLNVKEPKKLVFGDMPNRYFMAVPTGALDLEQYKKKGKGTITWVIPDSLAHSTVEKEFTAEENESGMLELTIVNNGSEAVPIDYEITHNHENGFIGIVSEHGAIELGRIDEEDDAEANKSVILVNLKKYSDFTSKMTVGSGVTSESTYSKGGTFKEVTYAGDKVNSKKTTVSPARSCLALNTLGSGSYYHGACMTMQIPADENGVVGATNWKVQARLDYETVKRVRQTGMFQLVVADADNKVIALIWVNKTSKTSNSAQYNLRVGEKDVKRVTFTPNYNNPTANWSKNLISIIKNGKNFTFNWCGTSYAFSDSSLASVVARSITVFMGNMNNPAESFMSCGDDGSSANNWGRMLLTDLMFRKDNVTYKYDVPNRYQDGSVVTVDGETAKVYVDGILTTSDEVLGSKYFLAPPGETKIQFSYSEFSTPAPTIKARIREAYL